ncbi:hypothetical protein GCM10027446_01440 [Angustibacter peucedani]
MTRQDARSWRRRIAWLITLVALIAAAFALGVRSARPNNRDRTPPGRVASPVTPSADSGTPKTAAVEAALNALSGLTSRDFVVDAAARARIIAAVATREDAAAATRSGQPSGEGGGSGPMAAAFAPESVSAWRLVPVGVRTVGCSDTECTVAVWSVQLSASTGEPAAPARATWATTSLPMVWTDAAGWRLRLSELTTSAGPTPGLPSSSAQSSDLDVVAAGRQFRPVTFSVDGVVDR